MKTVLLFSIVFLMLISATQVKADGINGTATVCTGSTTSLSDLTTGGTWSSSAPGIASVGTGSGSVTGISPGTATISYISSSGTATITVTVNPLPSAITGTLTISDGASTNLSDITGGGAWSSSNISVASIDAASGLVEGVSTGTSIISYALPTGCQATVTMNVITGSISGATNGCSGVTSICVGATTTLSDITTGGTWSSNNTSVATVGSATGILTGVATGTAVISYVTATSGTATIIVTVGTIPSEAPITGIMEACPGTTITMSDATPGGEWFSSDNTIATINSAGVVTCVSNGIVSINYAVYNSCGINEQFAYIIVGPTPINGTATICAGSSSVLSDSISGGTWSSGNNAIAIIGSATGNLTGVAAGSCVITYTIASGCTRTTIVNVIAAPALYSISGPASVPAGANINLSDVVSGGVWSSKYPLIAIVSSGGTVTGISAGIDTISYSVTNSCATSVVTYVVTVNSIYPITGNLGICSGNSTVLSDVTTGGTWSSSNTSVATIGSTSGVVTGVAAGTALISYITASGSTTAVVNVNAAPTDMPITGTMTGCVGSTINLSDATTGGEWFCSNNTIATINSSGVVTCIDSGIVSINYILFNGCGVSEQFAQVIVQSHSPINGSTNICTAASVNLTDANTGGTWSSSNTAVGTIGSASGHLTGITGGTTVITYTVPSGCGTTATVNVTAHPTTSPITGPTSVAIGSTIPLTDLISGGTWSSKFTSIATVNSSGTVTGVALGTDVISYSVSNSCFTNVVTYSVTVSNITVAPITGTMAVCSGSTTMLTDATASGTWSSSNTSVATVGTSGIVTGTGVGTAIITYSVSTNSVTATVTVNQAPAVIGGTGSVCAGATISLTDATVGGVWSCASGNATIGVTGIVTGVTAGTAMISYNLTGCVTAATITINTTPSTIQGVTSECAGTTITVSDATTGGTWSSSNANVTIDGGGNIAGINAGAAIISYMLADGCYVTYSNTVLASPSAITGAGAVCIGSMITLNDSTSGALSYTSSNNSVATVASSGQVAGIAAGTATITYMITSGCTSTTTVTVNSLPGAISGNNPVCTRATITLSDPSGPGGWSSGNTAIATIDPGSGVMTGVTGGTATITFIAATGCMITTVVTINTTASVSGNNTVCVGSTTTLSDIVTGGTWSSDNTGIASIDLNTGILTGISTGVANITYVPASGCPVAITATVTPAPVISGSSSMCPGTSITFIDAVSGGTWSSSDGTIATVDAASGVVTASASNTGTAIISYATAGCGVATQVVSVNPSPLPIQGSSSECAGTAITVSDASTGGMWSSSNGNATINGSGLITGISAGGATISYTLADGCYVIYANTILANPSNIAGTSAVCIGSTITLSDATTGGIWSSSSIANATIGSASGIVSGVAVGSTTITYAASGCISTALIIVNGLPGAITGSTPVCAGATITLSDPAGSGTWSSSNVAIAAVGSGSGVVTGIAGGTAAISYFAGTTGCKATAIVTVNPILSISGVTYVCLGTSATLSDASTGGTWSSNNTSIATVGLFTGLVTGVGMGSAAITYTLATGCSRSVNVTVGAMTPIQGSFAVCKSSTTILSDLTTGGTWSSSNNLVASIGTAGLVTASTTNTGTVTISYTLGSCVATQVITVNVIPLPIQGATSECVGITITLSDATAGGTWSSSNGNASINASGSITGIVVGTSTTTYTLPDGCYMTYPNTVHGNPVPITGTFTVCPGGTTMLSDTSTISTSYTSSSTTIATVVNSGVVTGVNTGTATITYKISTGCIATQVVTVIASPSTISGTFSLCAGSATLLSDASGSGTWSSSNTGFATVGSSTGLVTGVQASEPTITFTLASTGCRVSVVVTVTAIPNAGSLSGALTVAVGSNITLSSSGTYGGTWSTSNSNATVGISGIVTGVTAGTCTITYAVNNACGFSGAYKTITVIAGAPPHAPSHGGSISNGGITTMLVGASASLPDDGLSGIWSSSDTGIATVDVMGNVSGIRPGVVDIMHIITKDDEDEINVTSVVVSAIPEHLALLPNPNNGTFTVRGAIGNAADKEVNFEIIDVLGDVIYKAQVIVQSGRINETITLNNSLPNGMYLLSVDRGTEHKVFHFVIEQ